MLRTAVPMSTQRPSACRFLMGQSGNGRWIVADRLGLVGGLFIDRKTALHFLRAESSDNHTIDVNIAEVDRLELGDLFSFGTIQTGKHQ